MKQTSVLRQQLSSLQSSERSAMMFLETNMKDAGYNPVTVASSVALAFPASGSFAAGQAISGTGTGAGTDTLSVRFVASTGVTGQQGCSPSLNAGDIYTEVFSVSNGYLVCTETDNSAGTPSNANNLISGLTGMSVLYGVDTTGSGSQTEYLNANSVGGYWTSLSAYNSSTSIKTVTVTLTFTNPLAGQPGQPGTVSLRQTMPYTLGL
jgi:type IV pilus assembly protein PilW